MKIVVPIMPTSLEEAQALELSRFEGADIIEWRADFLDKDSILTVAPAIFELLSIHQIILILSISHARKSLTRCLNFQTWFCLIITLRRHLKTLWNFYLR